MQSSEKWHLILVHNFFTHTILDGAEDWIRTSTVKPPQGPEPCASTISATSAHYFNVKLRLSFYRTKNDSEDEKPADQHPRHYS